MEQFTITWQGVGRRSSSSLSRVEQFTITWLVSGGDPAAHFQGWNSSLLPGRVLGRDPAAHSHRVMDMEEFQRRAALNDDLLFINVTLSRNDDSEAWGLRLGHTQQKTVEVIEVRGGPASTWNQQVPLPQWRIKEGDLIVKINGQSPQVDVSSQFKNGKSIDLVFLRNPIST